MWARMLAAVMLGLLFLGAASAGEFHDLFNGKDLEGWTIDGPQTRKEGDETRAVWSVKDGRIVCDAGKSAFGFLRYDRERFGDFTLQVEYRFAPRSATQPSGNSGVGIRTVPFDPRRSQLTRPSYAAYEIQLLDDAGKPATKHSTGSLYRYHAPSKNAARPAPEWNSLEIECRGPRIRVRLNDEEIVDVDQNAIPDLPDANRPMGVAPPKDKPLSGYVCLQSHGGTVEFRKVRIRAFPP